jgi:starch synthase
MTGGLGDVAGSLPQALNSTGEADCRVIIPLYSDIPHTLRAKMKYVTNFFVPLSWRSQYCGVFEAQHNGVTYYFIDNEYYFKRPGLYGSFDDGERFAFFSRAVIETALHVGFIPDVFHANDWHCAMIPVYFHAFYASRGEFKNTRTVFTIHNVQYQGKFDPFVFGDILGLPESMLPMMEYEGCVNYMKGAVESANAVTTVSPTYANELRYSFYAYGLSPIINRNMNKLTGILNGIDTSLYDPASDPDIFSHFSAKDLEAGDFSGKAMNKKRLQEMLGLPQDEHAFLIGMVSRLVAPKGIDLVKFVLEELLGGNVQFVLLGKGDFIYENYFGEMRSRYPAKLSVNIGFIKDLAHKIYAGADALLMPSQSEPCGLAQMVALRYGTVPIVRSTGGLNDSIVDADSGSSGNGYTFRTINAGDMLAAIRRAQAAFADTGKWQALVTRAAECDFSWGRSARTYLDLYSRL